MTHAFRRRWLLGATAASFATPFLASAAFAQDKYPKGPIKLVLGFAPGGITDILARLTAARLEAALKTQVIVDNRPGAGGNIGAATVARSTPDGSTLFFGALGTAVTNQFIYANMPFDTANDFVPVALVASVPNVLLVHKDVPAKTIQELVALVKSKPGEMTYGAAGLGSSTHLAMELLKTETGMQIENVPYKGSALLQQDLLAGRIPVAMDSISIHLQHIRSGAVRALGVTSPTRAPDLPDVPTIAEAAVPGYDAVVWLYVAAPAKTPPEIVKLLSNEIASAVKSDEMQKKMRSVGAIPMPGSSEELARHISAETVRWKKIVDAAGLKPE
ncbi:MAG: tripartite tricarboxylate transporter substrate binding protein [Proteobacteria bacterium]|nr:tripartite tricarboxylate transporter substrate binding protein [Pseudomonadota bacterium]